MSLQEAKNEILGIIATMPEQEVLGILDYVRELQTLASLNPTVATNLSKIMQEDDEVLKKLAL